MKGAIKHKFLVFSSSVFFLNRIKRELKVLLTLESSNVDCGICHELEKQSPLKAAHKSLMTAECFN